MADELHDALRRLLHRPGASAGGEHIALEVRVDRLETDVEEVRGRINGLLFVVAGAVLIQLVMKVMG